MCSLLKYDFAAIQVKTGCYVINKLWKYAPYTITSFNFVTVYCGYGSSPLLMPLGAKWEPFLCEQYHFALSDICAASTGHR